MSEFHFYLPDTDRNSGWSNHTYVLQHVTTGEGDSPEEAWKDADLPESFSLPENLIVIDAANEVAFEGTAHGR